MLCPFADYLPIPASIVGVPIPMQGYYGAVEHVTQGGASSPYPWFCNPASEAFSHFWIGYDGELQQFMDTEYQSWAQEDGNPFYISVETAGYGQPVGDNPAAPLTDAQVETFGRLLAWLWQNHEMPVLAITDTPGDEGLILHGDGGVAWGDHPDCPGPLRAAQRGQILAIAAALVIGVPKPQPSKEDLMNITYANGQWVCAGVSSEGHPYVFYASDPAGPWGICDVTDDIASELVKAGKPPTEYTVVA
jgi:hypothetical protein